MTAGDAWRYCAHLDNPEAIKQLVQAALTAHAAIAQAQTSVDPEHFATALDWNAVQGELQRALHAIGHPAGD